MGTHSERAPRTSYEAPIQYFHAQSDHYYNSRMYNFSEGGLYFESLQALEPDSKINIMMPNYSPETAGPEAFQSYLAEIRWCQDRSDQKLSRYGVGVRILEKSHSRFIQTEPRNRLSCDMCGKRFDAASICLMDGSICLCPHCFQRLDTMPEDHIKSSIKRFLIGNVL